MLDLIPARHQIINEWDRDGTCSGQTPRAYFETVRKARAAVKIPPGYTDVQEPLGVTPRDVENAFINANPGLSPRAIAIGCARRRLTEVRLCLRICNFAIARRSPSAAADATNSLCHRRAASSSTELNHAGKRHSSSPFLRSNGADVRFWGKAGMTHSRSAKEKMVPLPPLGIGKMRLDC